MSYITQTVRKIVGNYILFENGKFGALKIIWTSET